MSHTHTEDFPERQAVEEQEGEDEDAEGELDEQEESVLENHAQPEDTVQQYDNELEDQAPYDDEFGEDEEESAETGSEGLDADGVHLRADGSERIQNEHATEYVDNVERNEEGEEGYGEDFADDGAEGVGTGNHAEGNVLEATEEELEPFDDEQTAAAPDQQAQIPLPSTTSPHPFKDSMDGDRDETGPFAQHEERNSE